MEFGIVELMIIAVIIAVLALGLRFFVRRK
jgi:hypothetical protein